MNLDKVIHQAHQASRDHAKVAGRAIGQALGEYNENVKKKKEQRYESELHEITRYHEDRVMKNKTYH